jgi:hypothetical protein
MRPERAFDFQTAEPVERRNGEREKKRPPKQWPETTDNKIMKTSFALLGALILTTLAAKGENTNLTLFLTGYVPNAIVIDTVPCAKLTITVSNSVPGSEDQVFFSATDTNFSGTVATRWQLTTEIASSPDAVYSYDYYVPMKYSVGYFKLKEIR